MAALPAGAGPGQGPELAQEAEGGFGVWGVPARLSLSSHRFVLSPLWAARPVKQALFGFSL